MCWQTGFTTTPEGSLTSANTYYMPTLKGEFGAIRIPGRLKIFSMGEADSYRAKLPARTKQWTVSFEERAVSRGDQVVHCER